TNYSGANPPAHTYANNGWYYVCLTMYDSLSNCQSSYCDTLYIGNSAGCSAYFSMVQDSANNLQWYAYPQVQGTSPFSYLWDFGDGNQSTQPYPSHTYATAGSYLVCLTITDANGCVNTYCDSSSFQRVTSAQLMQYLNVMQTPTGIVDNNEAFVSSYPNPADQFINLTFAAEVNGVVRITGLAGNLIAEQKINGRNTQLDVSGLAVGSYYLSVINGNSVETQRIVIIR
ncbi:MAG TPA: PKD domain-containing protein, partial [Bacteroidia bacterium]|nr:PKD domain-containing protein [Bacteroidia bacterium]